MKYLVGKMKIASERKAKEAAKKAEEEKKKAAEEKKKADKKAKEEAKKAKEEGAETTGLSYVLNASLNFYCCKDSYVYYFTVFFFNRETGRRRGSSNRGRLTRYDSCCFLLSFF